MKKGFTLIELLVVISIIGLLSSIVFIFTESARNSAREVRVLAELRNINKALAIYLIDYGDYPPDTDREVPPGLEPYLASGVWPEETAWPGSVFDWDNWADPDNPGQRIYQISVRFCPIGEPDECQFPTSEWAEDFDINSSVYYCIAGACRSHIAEPIDHPGYCINC